MLVEVLLESLISDELLFEFVGLLHLDSLVVESPRHILDPRLNLDQLLPEDGNVLYHVCLAESFLHFPLVKLQGFDFRVVGGLNKSQDGSIVGIDMRPVLLVLVVLRWGLKVHYIAHCLKLGLH